MRPTGPLLILCLLHASGAALVFVSPTASVTVPENATNIYTLKVTGGTVSSYAIQEAGAPTRLIIATTANGTVAVKPGNSLDYEKQPAYTLTITGRGADTTGTAATASMTLTVTVTNVAPSFDKAQSAGVNIANGTSTGGPAVGTFEATDPGGSPIIHALAKGNTNLDFTIDQATGEVTVATGKTIVVERTPCYTLVLHAVDNATSPLTGSTTVVITVTGGTATTTCTADSNPFPRSGATSLAVSFKVACLMALMSLILSTILSR